MYKSQLIVIAVKDVAQPKFESTADGGFIILQNIFHAYSFIFIKLSLSIKNCALAATAS